MPSKPNPTSYLVLADFGIIILLALLLIHGCHAKAQTQQVPATPPAASYRHEGPAVLNDLAFTPGATGTLTTAQLCDPAFHTGTVRNVTEATKQAVCRAYGIARADCTGKNYEIDHLISLELGGSNDIRNLWPQPYFPKPAAKEKDVVENALHRQVCSGKIPLAVAQQVISTNWYLVYQTIQHPDVAAALADNIKATLAKQNPAGAR